MRHWLSVLAVTAVGVLLTYVSIAARSTLVPLIGHPVAPPRDARTSTTQVPPFEVIGSPYLHMRTTTYTVSMTPQAIQNYYGPRLRALGYSFPGTGYSCSQAAPCDVNLGYQKGQYVTVAITIDPLSAKTSRYSVTMEQIVPPPRPEASIVPNDVRSLEIDYLANGGAAGTSRTITDAAAWRPFLRIVNSLPMDYRGVTHGLCLPGDVRAVVRIDAGRQTYTFSVNPSCVTVTAPGNAKLVDLQSALWTEVTKVLGVSSSLAP